MVALKGVTIYYVRGTPVCRSADLALAVEPRQGPQRQSECVMGRGREREKGAEREIERVREGERDSEIQRERERERERKSARMRNFESARERDRESARVRDVTWIWLCSHARPPRE